MDKSLTSGFIISMLILKVLGSDNALQNQSLTQKTFELSFMHEVITLVEKSAKHHVNELLRELKHIERFAAYNETIHEAQTAHDLEHKVLFVKQLIDTTGHDQHEDTKEENVLILRNVNFLSKLKRQLQQIHDEKANELHERRIYELCKQFRKEKQKKTKQVAPTQEPYPLMRTKLSPLASESPSENVTLHSIDLVKFGKELYERVKVSGAEVIDSYLITIRKLLQEVMLERSEYPEHSQKLRKVLDEIDFIVNTPDFYRKRQRLYHYLKVELAADYEDFKTSDDAEEYLQEILIKLKNKGLDLFVTFLFSNFEFLEHTHEQLVRLLPEKSDDRRYDDLSETLYKLSPLYKDFKQDSNSPEKYDAYMAAVKKIHHHTHNTTEFQHIHIYELLNNSSQNMGSVTINMIKGKCDEL